jgi:hypothetical protein
VQVPTNNEGVLPGLGNLALNDATGAGDLGGRVVRVPGSDGIIGGTPRRNQVNVE